MIGDARFAGQRDGNDLDRLVVVERLEDQTMKVFDAEWRTAIGGCLSVTVGQVLS
jgi:hypothetical protein